MININYRTAPRSGSTFIYQILRMLCNITVKGHDFHNDANVVVFRNFLDSALSLHRISTTNNNFKISTKEEIDHLINSYRGYAEMVNKFIDTNPNRLYFVYEYDIKNGDGNLYDIIFDKIEKFFNITITDEKKIEIIESTNITKNKEISDNHKTFNRVDEVSMIHGNHISNNGDNNWEDFVSEELHDYYRNSYLGVTYNECLKKLNYL